MAFPEFSKLIRWSSIQQCKNLHEKRSKKSWFVWLKIQLRNFSGDRHPKLSFTVRPACNFSLSPTLCAFSQSHIALAIRKLFYLECLKYSVGAWYHIACWSWRLDYHLNLYEFCNKNSMSLFHLNDLIADEIATFQLQRIMDSIEWNRNIIYRKFSYQVPVLSSASIVH